MWQSITRKKNKKYFLEIWSFSQTPDIYNKARDKAYQSPKNNNPY
jgi:hypothetical protein